MILTLPSSHCGNSTTPSWDLSTTSIDELASYQPNKNRRYTQLKPGKFRADFRETTVGDVQLFQEKINVGVQIEAVPADRFMPFGYILPQHKDYRFCGKKNTGSEMIQATGGIWDICFDQGIEYSAIAFNRDYFYSSYHAITQQDLPNNYFTSKLTHTTPQLGLSYATSINRMLNYLNSNSQLTLDPNMTRLLCSQILLSTLDTLPELHAIKSYNKHPRRIIGVKRVIDYLQVHAEKLPDMQMLCKIANLSERSLQNGFVEYLAITPIQYLRVVRLNGARRDLLSASYPQFSVTSIALKWGFLELGRFAKEYNQLFLELPSQTLRDST